MFYHRLQYKQLWSVVEAPNNEKSPSPVSPEEKLFPWPHVKLLDSFMFFAWKVTSTGRYAWWCLRKPKHLCQSQINLKLCLDTLEDIGSVATSWWLTYPSEKNIIVSVGMMTFQRYGKIKNNKHVPNQPGYIFSWANHYFLKGPSRWLLLILYDINPRGCWKKSLRWDSALSAFGHANRPLGGALRA